MKEMKRNERTDCLRYSDEQKVYDCTYVRDNKTHKYVLHSYVRHMRV